MPSNGYHTKLKAYHASMKDLLMPSKLKPFNEPFLKKLLIPDFQYFEQFGKFD